MSIKLSSLKLFKHEPLRIFSMKIVSTTFKSSDILWKTIKSVRGEILFSEQMKSHLYSLSIPARRRQEMRTRWKGTVSIIPAVTVSLIPRWNIRTVTSITLCQYLWTNFTATEAALSFSRGRGCLLVLTIVPACHCSPGRASCVYWNNNGAIRGRFWNSIIPTRRSFPAQTRGSALSLMRVTEPPALPMVRHMAVRAMPYKK